MKDLTRGSLATQLLDMTAFLTASMLLQAVYQMVNVYWVGRLGTNAVAGIAVAANFVIIAIAAMQVISVGTTTLIAQATGRNDQAGAILVFNQCFSFSIAAGLIVAATGLGSRKMFCQWLSSDAATSALAELYLEWCIPALCLQFPFTVIAAALRAVGIVRPVVALQILSILLNMILAPLMIFPIGPWRGLGVAGAAAATLLAMLVATILIIGLFVKRCPYLRFDLAALLPQTEIWGRIGRVGIPAGFELALQPVYMLCIYALARRFGSDAQAGFGIGVRLLQSWFLPVTALGLGVVPIVGQNFGGQRWDRVRKAVSLCLSFAVIISVPLALICYFAAAWQISVFSKNANVIVFGADYVRLLSVNFLAAGIVSATSGVFQGLGNTFRPLVNAAAAVTVFAVSAMLFSRLPGFNMKDLWYLSIVSGLVHASLNLTALSRELSRALRSDPGGLSRA